MSLQQKLRLFQGVQLGGVIAWESFQFPDVVNSDTSKCVIEGKHGTYRIAVTTSYAHPPLGWVRFTDGDHEIEGANQDAAWHDIATYLKAKEAKEGAEQSKPVGCEKPAEPAPVVVPLHNPLQIPDRSFVYYWAEPGAWYQNGPALVTRVNRDGSYSLTVFPEGSDPIHRNSVQRRSERLQNVCWEPYPESVANITMNHQHAEVAGLREEIEQLRADFAAFVQRAEPNGPYIPVRDGETIGETRLRAEQSSPPKRGPGRPPKAA